MQFTLYHFQLYQWYRQFVRRKALFISKVRVWPYTEIYWKLQVRDNSVISKGWTVEKRNLRFYSKINQNTVGWFQASFRRVIVMLVTRWCSVSFSKWKKKIPRKITKKIVKHHQVTSTPKTLRKIAWNHLAVFRLNFDKNRKLICI